jgi:predicted nucleic acid-binding protein
LRFYLDSNVFIYAALNQDNIGDRARSLLKEVQEGKQSASTSSLTFYELVWAVKKHRDLEEAVIAGEAFLGFSGLDIVQVSGDTLAIALELIKRYRLDPRDSIHAASALLVKADVIISSDEHFDKVKELKRNPI